MYLVFDIGGTLIKYGYLNERGEILEKSEFMASLTSLEIFIKTLSKIYFQSRYNIKGIALSCPGIINSQTGIVEESTAYPYLKGICLTEMLSKECKGIKVSVENDAKCAALAELWIGKAKEVNDAIVIVLGTGIGSAIIKDKKIYHGANLFAGEVSTVIVGYDQANCSIVTWSDIASTKALCSRVAASLGIKSIDGRKVFDLVKQNNQKVIKILDSFCFDLAIQLYNLQYIYDPEIICIGGGISRQEILIKKINDAIKKICCKNNQLLMPNVESCKFYNQANLIGALYHFKMVN